MTTLQTKKKGPSQTTTLALSVPPAGEAEERPAQGGWPGAAEEVSRRKRSAQRREQRD